MISVKRFVINIFVDRPYWGVEEFIKKNYLEILGMNDTSFFILKYRPQVLIEIRQNWCIIKHSFLHEIL